MPRAWKHAPPLLALALALGCVAPGASSPPLQPALHWRVVEKGNRQVFQTSVRVLGRQDSTTIVLLAMNHLGEPSYYGGIERELEGADLILVEGFARDVDLSLLPEAMQWIPRERAASARLLGVMTQAEWARGVSDDRWVPLDARLEEITSWLQNNDIPQLSDEDKRDLEAFEVWIDGDRTPEEVQEVRERALDMTFSSLISQETSTPPDMERLLAMRDAAIFAGLEQTLQRGKHRRIVMMYGFAHTRVLEPRIVSELGFRLETARWYDVLAHCRPRPSGAG